MTLPGRTRRRGAKSGGEIHESRAFVARIVDYGESDRIVTLITERLGKVGALARGARKSRRRFGAALSPYLLGTCTLAGRPSEGRLLRLDGYAVTESFPELARHIERVSLAGYFTELVRETIPEAQPEPEIFALLLEAHRLLDANPPGTGLVRAFELHLLTHLGLEPRLDQCMGMVQGEPCSRTIPTAPADDAAATVYGFDPGKGGVLCPQCVEGKPTDPGRGRQQDESAEPVRLSERAILAMRDLTATDLAGAARADRDLSAGLNAQIRSATEAKFATLIRGELKTVRFIKGLAKK